MHVVFFDSDSVDSFYEAAFVTEYTPTSVTFLNANDELETKKFFSALQIIKTDIPSAYDFLIGQGVNCALLEVELGFNPEDKVGFHVQPIGTKILDDGRRIYRQVDLQTMPIIPTLDRIRTVWKVKHYFDEARTQYAGTEFPDTVRTLIANNLVRITLPDGREEGEYNLLAEPIKAGNPADIKQILRQTVFMREAQGRFE